MNISVCLLGNLKDRLDSYANSKSITKNAAVRNVIELLLEQEKTSSWGSWMDHFSGDPSVGNFELNRSELEAPRKDIF